MNLTTGELIRLVEEHDSKAAEFEKNIVKYTGLDYSNMNEYSTSSIIVLLSSMKINQITVDKMLEQCLNQLHK